MAAVGGAPRAGVGLAAVSGDDPPIPGAEGRPAGLSVDVEAIIFAAPTQSGAVPP